VFKLQCNIAVIQAREKLLQQQVVSLQQLVSDLRLDLNNAKKHNEHLQKRLTEMVLSFSFTLNSTYITA